MDKYDTIITLVAMVSALGMMIGTGVAMLALGIWAMKAALGYGKPKKEITHDAH